MSTEKIELPPESVRAAVCKYADAVAIYTGARDSDFDAVVRPRMDACNRAIASYGKAAREKAIRECEAIVARYAYSNDALFDLGALLTPTPPEPPTALERAVEKLKGVHETMVPQMPCDVRLSYDEFAALLARLEGKPDPFVRVTTGLRPITVKGTCSDQTIYAVIPEYAPEPSSVPVGRPLSETRPAHQQPSSPASP